MPAMADSTTCWSSRPAGVGADQADPAVALVDGHLQQAGPLQDGDELAQGLLGHPDPGGQVGEAHAGHPGTDSVVQPPPERAPGHVHQHGEV
jgi:hypothetical protein